MNNNLFNKEKYFELQEIAKGLGYSQNFKNEIEKPFETYYNFQYKDKKDICIIAGMVYSWMPTKLDLYFKDDYDWNKLDELVKKYLNKDDSCRFELLYELCSNINHSIVGSSKILHLLKPDYGPIYDSRVIEEWNYFFNYNENIKLNNFSFYNNETKSIKHDKLINLIDIYIRIYWDNLLLWIKNIDNQISVRDIEILFYFINKEKNKRKN
ncbi:MAG TPA: hypothetical protein VIK14_02290 [Ignavibacteria bacterium]